MGKRQQLSNWEFAGRPDGLQAPPHGGREVRSYTANRRELRCGVVAAKLHSARLFTTGGSAAFDPLQP